jgi:lipid-binding SYLF domain-containing protein
MKDYCYPTVLDGIMVSSFYCSAGNFMAGLAPEGSVTTEQKHPNQFFYTN